MGFYLRVQFEVLGGAAAIASLSDTLRLTAEPGYSFYQREPSASGVKPVASDGYMLYAENYHRVYVSASAICFDHEIAPSPAHIALADARILGAILSSKYVRVGEWERGESGWDDDDRPYARVLDRGDGPDRLMESLAALHAGVLPSASG